MSWLQDLAGKAENILNKIDQNAATVLHQKNERNDTNNPNVLVEVKCEKVIPSPKFLMTEAPASPKNMLSLKKSLTVVKAAQIEEAKNFDVVVPSKNGEFMNGTDYSSGSGSANEKFQLRSNSNSTSRRSSISSRADGTVIEKETAQNMYDSMVKSSTSTDNVEQELSALKIVLNEIKSERDEAREELDMLREQIKNANTRSIIKELEDLCVQLREDKESLLVKNETLEKSNFNYIKSISDLETRLSKIHQSEADLRTKLDWAKQETEQANYELQQYRARAQTTLQMKEKLIEQLKSGIDDQHIISGTTPTSNTHSIEMEHLKAEKIGLLDEINIQNDQLEQIRRYVDRLETVQKDQQNEFEQKLHRVNENLRNEEQKWRQYESESKAQMRELAMVREEMSRLQSDYANKIHQKESELAKLRSQVAPRPSNIGSANGLEERVQSLTQSLVQKQNSLETVTADRNALRFQLEKIENQHRQTMSQLRQQRPQVINLNDTDDAKAQVPMFLQENPFDTGVARRVKRVYSTLDSMGVRLGVFLRRYPLIRILAIFYVVLLHLWVMVVLCSSTPN